MSVNAGPGLLPSGSRRPREGEEPGGRRRGAFGGVRDPEGTVGWERRGFWGAEGRNWGTGHVWAWRVRGGLMGGLCRAGVGESEWTGVGGL